MGHQVGHTSRGIRNNNPGNIRHGGGDWYGARAKQTDPEFMQFDNMRWGLRAIARTLQTYGRDRKAGDGSPVDTLAEIVTRWAPPRENDTAAYIRAVSKRTGFAPDQVLNLTNPEALRALTDAIVRHETGFEFNDGDIKDAVMLSFLNAD